MGKWRTGAIWCEISSTEQIYNPNTTPRTHRDVVLTGFKRDRAEPDHGVPASSLEQRLPTPTAAAAPEPARRLHARAYGNFNGRSLGFFRAVEKYSTAQPINNATPVASSSMTS
jgi:hypothetical protein